jgi:PPOX class probable F420-dependent enzyme
VTDELSPDLEAFLHEPRNAILCINRGDGRAPHATPVWFQYSSGRIYISITRTRVKYRLLREAPEVSLVIDDSEAYRTVVIEGRARFEEDDATLLAVVRALREKYGYGFHASDAGLLRDLHSEERVIVSFGIDRLLSWLG